MASVRKTLLAGVAVIGIGLAGAASAQTSHVMTVPVPGGGVAQIRYFGDVPPWVAFVPAPAAFDGWMPVSSVFGDDSPFPMLDRIAGEMDRRAAAMFRYAEATADSAAAGGPAKAGIRRDPVGRRELFLCLDLFRQRRVHADRPHHVARRRDAAAGRAAQLRELRRGGRVVGPVRHPAGDSCEAA